MNSVGFRLIYWIFSCISYIFNFFYPA